MLGRDGDDPTAPEVSRVSELALQAYLQRDFASAIARWKEILRIREDDQVATVMIARAEAFIRRPPPQDWNGVHVLQEK